MQTEKGRCVLVNFTEPLEIPFSWVMMLGLVFTVEAAFGTVRNRKALCDMLRN
jgi:hypothetical protein